MFTNVVSSTAVDPEFWISLVTSRNSKIQVLLDHKNDLDLDDDWLTVNERLTHFRKSREKIVGRVKVAESQSVQGPQSSEEYIVLRNSDPIMTDRLSVR